MGILDLVKEFRGQSDRPHKVRKGPPALEITPGTDLSIEHGGRYGTVGPENHHIVKDLENPWGRANRDMSVEGWDIQILNPQLKVNIKTGVRDRVKRVLSFLGD